MRALLLLLLLVMVAEAVVWFEPPRRRLPAHHRSRRAMRSSGDEEEWDTPIFAAASSLVTSDITAAANVTAALTAIVTDGGFEWYFDRDEPFGLGPDLWTASFLPEKRRRVAIIDSGVAQAALDAGLFATVVPGYDFISSAAISNDGDARDLNPTDPGDAAHECALPPWHGTKMAAAIAARWGVVPQLHSVAPNGTSLQFLRVLGQCSTGYASDAADAILWAAYEADVLSLSFVGRGACPPYMQAVIDRAVAKGAVLVAAAGNEARSASEFFPANCRGVRSLGAATREDGALAAYSNYDAELVAPGGDARCPDAKGAKRIRMPRRPPLVVVEPPPPPPKRRKRKRRKRTI
jgi:subtilisin family serine protease